MRILHVVSSPDFGGVERYLTYVAPALAERGCDVTVAGGTPAAMRVLLAGSGVRHVPARNVAEAAVQVGRLRHVDVVHAHMTAAEWAVVPVRPFTAAAYLSTRHFAAFRGRAGPVRALSRLVPKVLDQQIAISAYVASAIEGPAVVLHSGVPDSTADAGGDRLRVLLMLQRLEREKETELALRAWAGCAAAGQGWRLLLAGEGSEEERLRREATALGLNGSVEFLGHRSDVPALLGQAGALLATTPIEAFGLSVVEAMAAGVPVVAVGSGGHLETVGACTTEYLFPPGDAAACADRLDALLQDDGRRRAYGAALQAHQRRHLSLDCHVDRLLDLYEEVLARRRSRSG